MAKDGALMIRHCNWKGCSICQHHIVAGYRLPLIRHTDLCGVLWYQSLSCNICGHHSSCTFRSNFRRSCKAWLRMQKVEFRIGERDKRPSTDRSLLRPTDLVFVSLAGVDAVKTHSDPQNMENPPFIHHASVHPFLSTW